MQIEAVGLSFGPGLVSAIALLAVLGDALLPFLPSGSLVIAASLLCLGHGVAHVALLLLAVAAASFLGDLLLITLIRSGSSRTEALLTRHNGIASAARWFHSALADRLGSATLAGRFVPAGRTVLGMALGSDPGLRARYLRWSAVGGLVWACYLVGLAVLNGLWFETRWIGFAVSALAAVTISTCLARSVRRRAVTGHKSDGDSPTGMAEYEPAWANAGRTRKASSPQRQVIPGPYHRQKPRCTHPITGQDTAGGDPPRVVHAGCRTGPVPRARRDRSRPGAPSPQSCSGPVRRARPTPAPSAAASGSVRSLLPASAGPVSPPQPGSAGVQLRHPRKAVSS